MNVKKLHSLLLYCKENIPYYMDKISEEICAINSKQDLENIFERIPIVTKEVIKSNYNEFVTNTLSEYVDELFGIQNYVQKEPIYFLPNGNTIITEYTSGTSGTPFVTIKSFGERLILGRNLWNHRNDFSPVSPLDFLDLTHGRPVSNNDNEEDIKHALIRTIMNDNYSWWHTSTSNLETIRKELKQNNVHLEKLKVIENTGSYISNAEKKEYGQFFSCKIADNYGCREVWNIAYSCTKGHLHISTDLVFFELVDENGSVINEYNKVGEIVVTSLHLRNMPFLRYKLGDKASYIEGNCDCGQTTPRIRLHPDRSLIHGTNLHGNKYFKNIILLLSFKFNQKNFHSIQIVQIEDNKFIVNTKKCFENKSEFEQSFKKAANIILNNNYTFIFTYDEFLEKKSLFTSIVT